MLISDIEKVIYKFYIHAIFAKSSLNSDQSGLKLIERLIDYSNQTKKHKDVLKSIFVIIKYTHNLVIHLRPQGG